MKRRLNVLCVLVILVLCYPILQTGYYFGVGVIAGVSEAAKATEVDPADWGKGVANIKVVSLEPKNGWNDLSLLLRDSVYNEKSGEYIPVAYDSLVIGLQDDTRNMTANGITTLLTLTYMGLLIWALVLFIRLVTAINKSDIFNWKNVRRLRLLGFALLVSFLCDALRNYLTINGLSDVVSLSGYAISYSQVVDTVNCLLGICALIVAEVFAIGLRMKEEQELTI